MLIEALIIAAVVSLGIIVAGKAIITARAISRRPSHHQRHTRVLRQCRQQSIFDHLGETSGQPSPYAAVQHTGANFL